MLNVFCQFQKACAKKADFLQSNLFATFKDDTKKTISKFIHVRRPHPRQFCCETVTATANATVRSSVHRYFSALHIHLDILVDEGKPWILCISILFHSLVCHAKLLLLLLFVHFLSPVLFCFKQIFFHSSHKICLSLKLHFANENINKHIGAGTCFG